MNWISRYVDRHAATVHSRYASRVQPHFVVDDVGIIGQLSGAYGNQFMDRKRDGAQWLSDLISVCICPTRGVSPSISALFFAYERSNMDETRAKRLALFGIKILACRAHLMERIQS